MFDNYKVYNVDVFDIKWESTEQFPIKLPEQFERFNISIPVDHDEDYMLNYVINRLIEIHDLGDKYNLSISQAKIKVNSTYYFSKYINTSNN